MFERIEWKRAPLGVYFLIHTLFEEGTPRVTFSIVDGNYDEPFAEAVFPLEKILADIVLMACEQDATAEVRRIFEESIQALDRLAAK
jgi:hypothetical protein